MIVAISQLRGTFTHWLDPKYKQCALDGKFVLHKSAIPNKPKGFWISWNNGWEDWCHAESNFIKDQVMLKVEFTKPDMKTLLIDTKQDLDGLWREYSGTELGMSSLMGLIESEKRFGISFWNWLQKEKGIEAIALTEAGQWHTRMTTFMYGWDAECVFVFDPAKNIKCVE